jgi:hypothetical protein
LAAQNAVRVQAIAEADDASCASYGAVKGTDAFTICRMQKDQNRAQLEAQQQAIAAANFNNGLRMMACGAYPGRPC